jgi:predicted alpha-1,2-mannosidase
VRRLVALIAVAAFAVPSAARALPPMPPPQPDAVDLVDPTIGTLGAGFTFPGASAPYGMVQNSPDTEGYVAYTGYEYMDHFIRGFSLVHTESMGVPEGGQIPIMPTVGPLLTDVKQYESPFTHATEVARAGYYEAKLLRYGVDAELTAGTRVAMQRYTFPLPSGAGAPDVSGNVLFDIGREVAGSADDDAGQTTPGVVPAASASIVPAERAIRGSIVSSDGYPVHFYAQFDRPFTGYGTWSTRGGAPVAGSTALSTTKGGGAYASFDTSAAQVVNVRIGLSFVSEDNAKLNLESELGDGFDFDGLRAKTVARWSSALKTIDVQGFDQDQLTSFYTALFHVQQHPNVFEDVNGDYLGYDGQTHRVGAPGDAMPPGSTYYANYSMWDTYRAEMPLLMLIAPDRVRDMMYSLNAIAKQGGRIPRWGWMNTYADFMNGQPGINVIADAYCRGLVPADIVDSLYENMRALALDAAPASPGAPSHPSPSFITKGYIPGDASGTLEHSISDFALALMANKLHHDADRDKLLALAGNWHNQFDPDTRFMRPRNAAGAFTTNSPLGYSPELPDGWKEGTGWQYSWLVPQDVRGLFDAMGAADGDALVQQRMTEFFGPGPVPYAGPEFQQKLALYGIAYYGNQYAPDNEHDLQAPWLYDWLGQPSKTAELQRAMQTLYRAAPDGLPGNDDLGTMSAWFVWSALGFYPVTPGSPTFAIGSPMFNRAIVHRKTGDIEIDSANSSVVTKYVQKVLLGDDAIDKPWFRFADVAHGARLDFVMGANPTSTWATDPKDAPPSMSSSSLSSFACGQF